MATNPYALIVSLAERLNRFRALTDEETDWLEFALRKEAETQNASRNHSSPKRFWHEDAEKLERMLRNGKSPLQIANELQRSHRAVYRKMHKLGLRVIVDA